MNIYDISKKAGVSIATVSRVINGSTNVSPKTKEKVLSIIEEVGYTPNAFARGLGLNTMQTIGILCADSSDPYMANAIYYLEKELRSYNYNIFLCCTGYDLKSKQNCLQLLINKQVDAIIFVGSNFINDDNKDNDYIRNTAKNIPTMIINGILSYDNIYCICSDDYSSMYDATNSFIERGKTNIIYLHNKLTYSGKQKLKGYLHAMEEHDLTPSSLVIEYEQKDLNSIKEYLIKNKSMLDNKNVILCADDSIAVGALKYCKENNLRVPEDVEILGYNNSYITQCTEPELSSIDNQLEELCKSCIATLMGVFEGATVPRRLIFETVTVKRNSTLE